MKNRPVAAELFHAGRQTDITKLLAILLKHPKFKHFDLSQQQTSDVCGGSVLILKISTPSREDKI